jgi:hypothetical protein
MVGNLFSRDGASSVFVAVMAVCLPLALLGQVLFLSLHRGPVDYDVGTAADVCGWLFTAAFVLTFGLTIYFEDRKGRQQAR